MVQHLAFSVSHHKAVSSSLTQGTYEFLDKSKQNQPECDRLVDFKQFWTNCGSV